jgi:hypothetical protein
VPDPEERAAERSIDAREAAHGVVARAVQRDGDQLVVVEEAEDGRVPE